MGHFVPAPGLFAPGQYTAVSNQAHVVMAIACLVSTMAFGLHSTAISGAWVRTRYSLRVDCGLLSFLS